MNAKGHPSPSVVAKDAIRGIRYALKRGAKFVVEVGPRQLVEQFEAASSQLVGSAESLAITIDKVAQHILGLEFDPINFKPPAFTASLDANAGRAQISSDAANLFFALSISAKNMGINDLRVSETLCAKLIAEDASCDWPTGEQDPSFLCFELYKRIIGTDILGAYLGISSQHKVSRLADISQVAFATSLWVYVERGSYGETEEELLKMCCDITSQKSLDIVSGRDSDEAIRNLFDYALSVI